MANFYPTTNKLGLKRDFNYFTIFLGFNYEHNETVNEINNSDQPLFEETNIILGEMQDNIYYSRAKVTSDNYFTPNIFLQKSQNRKTIENLAWLTSLYVDIDGIDGVTTIQQARKEIYALCRKEGLKKPNYIVHTSTNPFVHVQAFWLIDPIYVYKRPENLSWWTETATALSEIFKTNSKFHVDTKASRNPAGYLRIPYTFNQKTGQQVTIIDSLLSTRRFTLQDSWLQNLRQTYRNSRQLRFNSSFSSDQLLEHPQIKLLLSGVPTRFRNLSQYAIAKCCYADGLSIDEAIEVILAQNQLCSNPEKERKVIDVTKRAYGIYGPESKCLYNIDSEIVAQTVNSAFNTQFDADPQITAKYKRSIHKQASNKIKREPRLRHDETVRRVVYWILKMHRQGKNIKSQEQLSLLSNVKYDSLKHSMKQINIILGTKKLALVKIKNHLSIIWLCNISIVLKGGFSGKKIVVANVETGGNPVFGLSQGLVGNRFWVVHNPGSFHILTYRRGRSPTQI